MRERDKYLKLKTLVSEGYRNNEKEDKRRKEEKKKTKNRIEDKIIARKHDKMRKILYSEKHGFKSLQVNPMSVQIQE